MTAHYALKPLPPPWDRILPPATRLFVWLLLLITLIILRSFFLLIFLTFVFGYIQSHSVNALAPRIKGRKLRVWLVAAIMLAVLTAAGSFLTPLVRTQAALFGSQYSNYLRGFDMALLNISKNYPVVADISPQLKTLQDDPESWSMHTSPTKYFLSHVMGLGAGKEGAENFQDIFVTLTNLGGRLLAVGSAFLLSLLFSFLIVLDLPRLAENVRSLKNTSLRFIYDEVADDIYQFGNVLGRALEAQLLIALFNAALTSLGMYVLGLHENLAFLAVVVFLCSFVPVAGVFVSSVPITLLALEQGGMHSFFLAVGLIVAIHVIETYILNPRIYGHHLHMNPVLVLSVLTISGKLFQVWGLVLGVPVCTYFFGHYIRRKNRNSA